MEEKDVLEEFKEEKEAPAEIPEEFDEEPDFGADRLELESTEETKEEDHQDEEEPELQEKPDYEQEILQLVRSNASPRMMRERLEDYHGKDIAEALPSMNIAEPWTTI